MDEHGRDFQVQLLEFNEIHELPDGWPPARLQRLLTALEMDDVAANDALEMAVMALQDRDVDEASDAVLRVVFGESMRPGVRQNLIPDLREDRPWEEFADLSRQAGIFDAVVLLQRAFLRDFGKPDAVSLVVRIETESETGRTWLEATPPDAALLLRLLAAGLNERAVLRRLYEDALAGTHFPDAGAIAWRVTRRDAAAPAREFELISSHQWFGSAAELESFSARGWPDAAGSTPPRPS